MEKKGAQGLTPTSALSCLTGLGPARARHLQKAGITNLGQLIAWLPRTWEIRADALPLGQLAELPEAEVAGGIRAFYGTVHGVKVHRFRGRTMVRAELTDGTGALGLVWFNSPWMAANLEDRERRVLVGRPSRDRHGAWQLVQPKIESPDDGDAPGIRAVYPSVEGVGLGLLQKWIREALGRMNEIPDWIPEDVRRRHALPSLDRALRTLHQPGPDVSVDDLLAGTTTAHRRLAYGELLESQLTFAARRAQMSREGKPHRMRVDTEVRSRARDVLPFPLTGAQRRVLAEIVADLQGVRPMQRLLQGDVGSGKTVVAALTALVALESGLQVAVMAPTTLLAGQLRRSFEAILGSRHEVALLAASREDSAAIRSRVALGEVGLVVGTHALFSDGTGFSRLGLVIVDEQHRFGVSQRRALVQKGLHPDLLVMTATPIPRSLALAAWGDLDQSVIDELPPGRQPVETEIVPTGRRRAVEGEIHGCVERGERVYVVVPAIEDRSESEVVSVEEVANRLEGVVGGARIGILHSGVPEPQRESTLKRFADGGLGVIVATTVIEVGVDVPDATLMVIEGAERFGLAQLHQLRGRVGRGARKSRCVAIHGRVADLARRRLEAFASTTDGFRLADLDLELRGPGEALGTRQTGSVRFRIADPVRDVEWLLKARDDARELLEGEASEAFRRRAERRLARAALGAG